MSSQQSRPTRPLIGAAAVIAAAFVAGAASAETTGVPVADFILPNGLELVVIPDHRAPIVTHMVWYKVGSADEPPGKSGIAHFFEHLMFKATTNHPAGEFDAAVSAIGGNDNAFTSYDYTCFHEMVPPSALEEMMGFEADRMRNLVLDEQTVATERDVILDVLFEFARQFFDFTALFTVQGNTAEGRDSFGEGASREKVARLAVPLDAESMLASARRAKKPIRTKPARDALDPVLMADLGRDGLTECIVFPIVVRTRVVALRSSVGESGGPSKRMALGSTAKRRS